LWWGAFPFLNGIGSSFFSTCLTTAGRSSFACLNHFCRLSLFSTLEQMMGYLGSFESQSCSQVLPFFDSWFRWHTRISDTGLNPARRPSPFRLCNRQLMLNWLTGLNPACRPPPFSTEKPAKLQSNNAGLNPACRLSPFSTTLSARVIEYILRSQSCLQVLLLFDMYGIIENIRHFSSQSCSQVLLLFDSVRL
jgi:hypothetical protein